MGEYVDKLEGAPFDWGDRTYPGTGSEGTKDLVEQKYAATMATAESMLERLVGTDGNSGYLGALNSIITEYAGPVIADFSVAIPDLSISVEDRPAPEIGNLDLDFPSFDKASPTLSTLPTIDASSLEPGTAPESITAAVDWLESTHDEKLFTELMTRIIADLQTGATGLSETVEQEIYDRAIARLEEEEDEAQQEVEEYFSATGFDLPQGAKLGALTRLLNKRIDRRADLDGKIMIEQADLAQKNSQFIIGIAKDLEAVLRDFTSKRNDRSLDYAKAVALQIVSVFSEEVKLYVAEASAKKAFVEAQVEHLKGVVAYNQGLVDSFKAEAEAYNTIVTGKASRNDAIVRVFEGENDGYEAETRAVTANQQVQLGRYELVLKNAEAQLNKAIAEVDASLRGFTAESSLRERVSADMANIAMQAVASAYGSVNMSAGLSHSTGRHESESFGHSESRSQSYGRSNSLGESHSYEHDPVT